MPRKPVPPLEPGWVIVNGSPMFHRFSLDAGDAADAMVHVHGFGISGTYLEPTAALLAPHFRTFVPDLPGMGRSIRPEGGLDLPGLAKALMAYCDTIGVERPILVGNSLGCPIIVEVATTFPDRIERAVVDQAGETAVFTLGSDSPTDLSIDAGLTSPANYRGASGSNEPPVSAARSAGGLRDER